MFLTNNSIVTNTDIGTGAAALVCTTTYTPCCSSANNETQWYSPNGSQVPNNPNLPYQRTRGRDPGRVILSCNSESTTTGIFHCDLPDASGATQSLYVGIYDSGTGVPTATSLVYSETTRSLTCTSTGGPATTVTWRKDGVVITIDGTTYQQTKMVTDPVTGSYESVLTIDQSTPDVFGIYSCTVGNTRGTSAAIDRIGILDYFNKHSMKQNDCQNYIAKRKCYYTPHSPTP